MRQKTVCDHHCRASVTVYLALSLLIVLILICTLIESGRVAVMNAKARGITYMSLDSLFSEYAAPVFEDYGVMMLWCKEEEAIKRFEEYASYNLDATDASLLPTADLYGLSAKETTLLSLLHMDENNGAPFEEQVYEYMDLFIFEDVAEELLAKANVIEDSKRAEKWVEKIDSHKDDFLAVEKSVGRLESAVDKAQTYTAEQEGQLSDLYDALTKYEASGRSGDLSAVNYAAAKTKSTDGKLNSSFDKIESEAERYHMQADKAMQTVKELEQDLRTESSGGRSEYYDVLAGELEELKKVGGDKETDFYKIEQNLKTIEQYRMQDGSRTELFAILDSGITKENVQDAKYLVSAYSEELQNVELADLLPEQAGNSRFESPSFIREVSLLFEKGVLDYVAPDCSEKKIALESNPSQEYQKDTDFSDESLLETGKNKVLYSEYIRKHFGRYTEPIEGTALEYEAEYILCGKPSDRENLQSIMNRIILLRAGCNLLSLFTDSEKTAAASAMAAGIATAVGLPAAEETVKLVILSAWALAEGIVDAKILFRGEKVPLIKQPQEWNLSFEGLKHFSKEKLDGVGSEQGLSYDDYLRIFLLVEQKPKQILRTLDLIQFNMRKNENESFLIHDCIAKVSVAAVYHAPPKFISFSFITRNLGSLTDGYDYEIHLSYSY